MSNEQAVSFNPADAAFVHNDPPPAPSGDRRPKITVLGVGGAGGNAVNNMIRSGLSGVSFITANTDAQALEMSQAETRVQLGSKVTQGLGAGAKPEIGREAAEESLPEVLELIRGSHMVFITAGMGGGTGTGAAGVFARAARDQGILTVGVVTKPFAFEGMHRTRIAEWGISELQDTVDTLIIIPNQNLFKLATPDTTFADAFKMADDVLHAGIRGVTDLIVNPGLINLDFADIRTVMHSMGKAMMGTGEASGENRAIEAAELAIANPLLEDVSMQHAGGVLINITGGSDMTLFEVNEAAERIAQEVDGEPNIIFGSAQDDNMSGKIRVSVVATGVESMPHEAGAQPQAARRTTPSRPAPSAPAEPARPAMQPAATVDEPDPEEVGDEDRPRRRGFLGLLRGGSKRTSRAEPRMDAEPTIDRPAPEPRVLRPATDLSQESRVVETPGLRGEARLRPAANRLPEVGDDDWTKPAYQRRRDQ